MATNTYLVGQAPALATAFSDTDGTHPLGTSHTVTVSATGQIITYQGALLDPLAVTLVVKAGNGVETTYTYGVGGVVVRDQLGVFYASIPVTVAGWWHYRWVGDAGSASAKLDEGMFLVKDVQA